MRFDANVQGLPWAFRPEKPQMTLKLGEIGLVNFIAENGGKAATDGTATFNVQPDTAGIYFNKIECFCFTEQHLKAGRAHGNGRAVLRLARHGRRPGSQWDADDHALLHVLSGRRRGTTRRAGDRRRSREKACRRTPAGRAARGGWDRTIMAEAHAKHHDYHLVNPSPWPIIGAVSAFVLALALIFAMHGQIS